MKLDAEQQAILDCTNNNIIVDAGAGSGKTRTLTEKVKQVLKSGVNPQSVVVITFTNRAANELTRRLDGVKGISKCFIGTIHSYASNLLKKSGYNFEIFSESHQTMFMLKLLEKYGNYSTKNDYEEFLKYDKLVMLGKMSKKDIPNKFSDYKVYHELMCLLGRESDWKYPVTVMTLCKENNILTFDELIKLSTEFFDKENIKLEYLFVDELQDIGYPEYNFLLNLNSTHNFFIGDDYQAIFGFKGGDVNIFLSLMKNPDWSAFQLSTNYRTCKSVLMYANTIIQKASNIIKKTIKYGNTNQGKLEFITKSNLDTFLSNLSPDEDWFILTRSNKEMNMIETALNKRNIKNYCFKQSAISDDKLSSILDTKCIKVLTIHSAKGLECENVALYGKLPVRGTGDSDEIKVFYVGLTRCKNRCVVFV